MRVARYVGLCLLLVAAVAVGARRGDPAGVAEGLVTQPEYRLVAAALLGAGVVYYFGMRPLQKRLDAYEKMMMDWAAERANERSKRYSQDD